MPIYPVILAPGDTAGYMTRGVKWAHDSENKIREKHLEGSKPKINLRHVESCGY